jgi:Tol biopolymer transport system component
MRFRPHRGGAKCLLALVGTGAMLVLVGFARSENGTKTTATNADPSSRTATSASVTKGVFVVGGWDSGIWLMSRQGKRIRTIVCGTTRAALPCSGQSFSFADDPVISPDGTRVAFVGGRSIDHTGLWLVNIDGRGLEELSPAVDDEQGYGVWHPVWSPDGRSLAFQQELGAKATGSGVDTEVRTLRVSTRATKRLRGSRSDSPIGWGDQGAIAVLRCIGCHGGAVLGVRNAGGFHLLRRIGRHYEGASPDYSVDWSPDRTRFLLEEGGTIKLFDPRTDSTRVLGRHTSGVNDYQPKWSPDGRSIAFFRDCSDSAVPSCESGIWTALTGGGPSKRVPSASGVLDTATSTFDW